MKSDLNSLQSILKGKEQQYQLVIAIRGGEEYLISELNHKNLKVHWKNDRFYLIDLTAQPLLWVQWSSSDFEMVEVSSINAIIQKLKSYALFWSNYTFDFHRRQALVLEAFTHQGVVKRLNFPEDYAKFQQQKNGGFWTLLEANLLLVAKKCSSWKYLGEMEFVENKVEPPSRAYLKLWEIFMYLPHWPLSHQSVMDLGACPGGWTWVLKNFVREVVSVDKAVLVPQLMKDTKVKFVQESIFALDPKAWSHIDWLFCDVICYPEKIVQLIQKWLQAGHKGNFVFTIKFQGKTDFSAIDSLLAIQESKLIHLYHNKHELTWLYLQNQG